MVLNPRFLKAVSQALARGEQGIIPANLLSRVLLKLAQRRTPEVFTKPVMTGHPPLIFEALKEWPKDKLAWLKNIKANQPSANALGYYLPPQKELPAWAGLNLSKFFQEKKPKSIIGTTAHEVFGHHLHEVVPELNIHRKGFPGLKFSREPTLFGPDELLPYYLEGLVGKQPLRKDQEVKISDARKFLEALVYLGELMKSGR